MGTGEHLRITERTPFFTLEQEVNHYFLRVQSSCKNALLYFDNCVRVSSDEREHSFQTVYTTPLGPNPREALTLQEELTQHTKNRVTALKEHYHWKNPLAFAEGIRSLERANTTYAEQYWTTRTSERALERRERMNALTIIGGALAGASVGALFLKALEYNINTTYDVNVQFSVETFVSIAVSPALLAGIAVWDWVTYKTISQQVTVNQHRQELIRQTGSVREAFKNLFE